MPLSAFAALFFPLLRKRKRTVTRITTTSAKPATIITIGFMRILETEAKTINVSLSVMSLTPLIVGAVYGAAH
jgi:hypothetical protein